MIAYLFEKGISGLVNTVKAEVYMLLKIPKQMLQNRLVLCKLFKHLLNGMPLPSPLQRNPNESLISFHRGLKPIN